MHLLVPVGQPAADPQLITRLALEPARVEAALQAGAPQALALPLLTHQFLHAGWIHLTMNMVMLLSVGAVTERLMGRGLDGAVRVVALLLLSGVGGAVAFILLNPHSTLLMMGASGALSGLYGALLVAVARRGARRGARLETRDRATWMALASIAAVFIGLNVVLAAGARVSGFIPIAWETHLAGFVTGCLLQPLLGARPHRTAGPAPRA